MKKYQKFDFLQRKKMEKISKRGLKRQKTIQGFKLKSKMIIYDDFSQFPTANDQVAERK